MFSRRKFLLGAIASLAPLPKLREPELIAGELGAYNAFQFYSPEDGILTIEAVENAAAFLNEQAIPKPDFAWVHPDVFRELTDRERFEPLVIEASDEGVLLDLQVLTTNGDDNGIDG